jgi:Integrase core domain
MRIAVASSAGRCSEHGADDAAVEVCDPSLRPRFAQYTSIEFGHRCRDAGVRPSTGSVGDAYDNAMCESFFATLECELLDSQRFRTQAEARSAVFTFIEGFYNPRRRHSSIGYLSRSTMSAGIGRRRSIPTHTSLPLCSRPSRTSPSGGPKMGPSLTAAVRDGRTIVPAGPPGPN